jgi:hypothetical protein
MAGTFGSRAGRHLEFVESCCFVGFDIFKAVTDTATNLQVARAIVLPTPPLQCTWADVPAAGELALVKVLGSHVCFLRIGIEPGETFEPEGLGEKVAV